MNLPSPPLKRIKLESSPEIDQSEAYKSTLDEADLDEEHCSICLQPLSDRTLLPECSHEFCFDCILIWTEQSRKCPLCARQIGEYLIHNIRSKYDYQKHYLAPLRTLSQLDTDQPLSRAQVTQRRRARREVEWGRNMRRERERERKAADELERAVEKRRWVYRHNLYAKHVASNSYTRHRPLPNPQQFATNPDLISRATIFIRRELRVWDALDVEFLTTFTISIMKQLDIRSEPAIKLIAEFLDMDNEGRKTNAEHFAHELYSYLRSPFRDLTVYDSVVQYDTPEDLSPPIRWKRRRRWASESLSPSRSPSPGPSRVRSRNEAQQHPRAASPRSRENITRPSVPESAADASRRKGGLRSRSASRQRQYTDSRRQDGERQAGHRTMLPISPRGRARSRSLSTSRRVTERADARTEDEWSGANGVTGVRDTKGKGRAIDVEQGMEARTYMHRQRGSASDCGGPAVEEGSGRITRGATAADGQSAVAENGSTGPSAGAGLVGPGGLNTQGGTDGSQAAAPQAAQARSRTIGEERPKVNRDRWKSLSTYLTGEPVGVPKRPAGGRRPSPNSDGAEQPTELSIRGAARRGVDPTKRASTEHLSPPARAGVRRDEDKLLDRTATGTPALQALTPGISESPPAEKSVPKSEAMTRTRARLAKLKAESLGHAADSLRDATLSSDLSSESGTRIDADTHPRSPSTPSTLLPMAMATAVESPQPSTQSTSPRAGAVLRAKLLDRLEQEKSTHVQYQEAPQCHGDQHEASYPGLSGGPPEQHAAAQPALDASVAASVRRDAEMLEAELRRQARLRVASGSKANIGSRAASGEPSAVAGVSETSGVDSGLQTREEALRARLKRSK